MRSLYFINPQILHYYPSKIKGKTQLKNDEKPYFFYIYSIKDTMQCKLLIQSIIKKNSKLDDNKSIYKYKQIFVQTQKQLKQLCQLQKGNYLILVRPIKNTILLKQQIKIKKQFRTKIEMMISIIKIIIYLNNLQFYNLKINKNNFIKDQTHQIIIDNIFQYQINKIAAIIVQQEYHLKQPFNPDVSILKSKQQFQKSEDIQSYFQQIQIKQELSIQLKKQQQQILKANKELSFVKGQIDLAQIMQKSDGGKQNHNQNILQQIKESAIMQGDLSKSREQSSKKPSSNYNYGQSSSFYAFQEAVQNSQKASVSQKQNQSHNNKQVENDEKVEETNKNKEEVVEEEMNKNKDEVEVEEEVEKKDKDEDEVEKAENDDEEEVEQQVDRKDGSHYVWMLAFIFGQLDIQQTIEINRSIKHKAGQIQQIRQFILKKGRYADNKMNQSISTLIYHMIKPQNLRISLQNVLSKLEKILSSIRRPNLKTQILKHGLLPLFNPTTKISLLYKQMNGPQNQRLVIINQYELFIFYNPSTQKLILQLIHNNYPDALLINHLIYKDLPENIRNKFHNIHQLFEYIKDLEYQCIKLTSNGYLAFYLEQDN